MKALSIRRPWAYMILAGLPLYKSVDIGGGKSKVEYSGKNLFKNIENRSRPLPKSLEIPQRIQIHVGLRDVPLTDELMDFIHKRIGVAPASFLEMYFAVYRKGVLAGEVTVTGQVTESANPWLTGRYGYVLKDPVLYDTPIPCRGKLGLFEPDIQNGKLLENIQR